MSSRHLSYNIQLSTAQPYSQSAQRSKVVVFAAPPDRLNEMVAAIMISAIIVRLNFMLKSPFKR